jgi:hypothetical protein
METNVRAIVRQNADKRVSKRAKRKGDNDALPYVAFTSEFEVQRYEPVIAPKYRQRWTANILSMSKLS